MELRIDEIVVRGIDVHDPPRFAEQISARLADLVLARGLPPSVDGDRRRAPHDVTLAVTSDELLARGVADAIWRTLGGTP